jgi:alkylation response protein AidB-like acyl-CoA dehydrogenase
MMAELQIELTAEQEIVRDGARRFAQQDYGAMGDDEAWAMMAELGWLACALPDRFGGFPGGARMLALVAQEFGRALVSPPLVAVASLSAQLLAKLGTGRAIDLLGEISAGTRRLCVALDEPGQTLYRADIRASRTGRGWELSGRSVPISFGSVADGFLVPAMADDGLPLLFLVSRETDGLEVDAYKTFDGRSAANLLFEGVQVEAGALVASGDVIEGAMIHAWNHALIIASAEILGSIETAFEATRDYLRTRQQFGQPIGEFQVLRHRLVDMYIELEQARSMVLLGTSAIETSAPDTLSAVASAVKARVGRAAKFVAGQAVQLHGGIGMTEEHLVGPIFQRATAFDLVMGSVSRHQARFTALGNPAF